MYTLKRTSSLFKRMFQQRHSAEYNASAEGGNRTLIPGGNTILSRARLPIPPLRLICAPKVYHSQHEGQDETRNYRITSIRQDHYLQCIDARQRADYCFRGTFRSPYRGGGCS